ncbi:glycosyltransferase [Thermodesulfovibrio yellowstonii]|nr:glycosyltransferase [Thermodesulfovibrio yellowstonii]
MNKIKYMIIVAPSLWIKNLVQESPILCKFPIFYIPNGVNTEIFKKHNKMKIRESLGISPNKKVILFIAEDFFKDKRKGGIYLIEALRLLDRSFLKNLVLLIIGKNDVNDEIIIPVDIIKTGSISNDIQLAEFYSSADLMVLPTLADNLPNTLLESMSCGTPVVAFNNGGVPEVIKHMENGYLVKNRDVEELARALKLFLSNDIFLKSLSENCRNHICKNFSQDKEIKKYIELYSELIKNEKSFY